MTAAWRGYLAASGLVLAGLLLVPDGVPRDSVFLAAGASCVVAIVVGAVRHRPATRGAWFAMAAGMALWLAGDATYSWLEDVAHATPFPSVADALYLAAYPFLAGGLARLAWVRRHGRHLAAGIDATIVTLACGLVSWVLVAGPVARSDAPVLERVIGVAYPVMDLVILAGLAWLVTSVHEGNTAFRLLATAAVVLVVADTLFLLQSAGAFADPAGALDLGWLAVYGLWGAAALHPGMRTLGDPTAAIAPPVTRQRIAALGIAVLVPPATHAVRLVTGAVPEDWAFVAVSTVMFLLVVARMSLALQEIRRSEQARQRLAADLAHQAAHDALTSLTNRPRFLEVLRGALHRAQRAGTTVAVLFVDLDDFKRVNDTYGHAAGDHALRVTAGRMLGEVRGGDTVGRLGGDEFVVLVEQVGDEADVLLLGERILAAIRAPLRLPDVAREVSVGASIGIALSRDGGTDPELLLHDADAAAYRAKRSGRGRCEVFDDALRRDLDERAALEDELAAALDGDELVLHYQPVFDVASGKASGYEALLRWDRPGHGLVDAAGFLPLAEQSSLVCRLGRWVLHEATAQLARWSAQDPAFAAATVSVDVSVRHVCDSAFVHDVQDALARSGLAPGRLVLEVPEPALADGWPAERLDTLRRLGVRVAVDAYGAGPTSLYRLGRHVDAVKLDPRLVAGVHPAGADVLRLLVRAAHSAGLTVVAEGVEVEHQLAALAACGCDGAQGKLLARARPAGEIEVLGS